MKRIILLLLICVSFAAVPPDSGWSEQPIAQDSPAQASAESQHSQKRKAEVAQFIPCGYIWQDGGVNGQWHICPLPVQVPFLHCAFHGGASPPVENSKVGYLFSTCMSINPICFNQAAPGSNFCSLHIPPPMPCRCTVPMPGGGLCAQPCSSGNSGYCNYHYPPDLRESDHVEDPVTANLPHN